MFQPEQVVRNHGIGSPFQLFGIVYEYVWNRCPSDINVPVGIAPTSSRIWVAWFHERFNCKIERQRFRLVTSRKRLWLGHGEVAHR
jgi:hypothetical protein